MTGRVEYVRDEDVLRAAAALSGVAVSRIVGRERSRRVQRVRRAVVVALRRLGRSYPEIGAALKITRQSAVYLRRAGEAEPWEEIEIEARRRAGERFRPPEEWTAEQERAAVAKWLRERWNVPGLADRIEAKEHLR